MYHLFNRYVSKKVLIIIASEFILLFLTSLLMTAIRFSFERTAVVAYDPQFIKTMLLTLTYATVFYYFGLYRPEVFRPGRQMFIKLIQATAVASVVLFCLFFIFPMLKTWRGIILGDIFVIPFVLLGWRTLISRFPQLNLPDKRVLIIGSGAMAKEIGFDIYKNYIPGLELVGFVDNDPSKFGKSIVNPGVIGGYGDIRSIAKSHNIDRIIVALNDRRKKLPMSALLDCKLHGIIVEDGETFNERATGKIPLDHLKPSWMVFSDGFKSLRSRKISKRLFDVCLSGLGLAIAAPVLILATLFIRLDSDGPIIFRQERVGENGKIFKIYKFRSMRQDAEKKTGPVWAKANDDRITRVGRILRKTRIDELPQMINVLKGDMSFVGPRPERPYFVSRLKEEIPYYDMRTVAKPGITGWAQIKYSYGATVGDALKKLQFDIYYIKNMSPLFDLMIIFWTVKVVLTGRGAR